MYFTLVGLQLPTVESAMEAPGLNTAATAAAANNSLANVMPVLPTSRRILNDDVVAVQIDQQRIRGGFDLDPDGMAAGRYAGKNEVGRARLIAGVRAVGKVHLVWQRRRRPIQHDTDRKRARVHGIRS